MSGQKLGPVAAVEDAGLPRASSSAPSNVAKVDNRGKALKIVTEMPNIVAGRLADLTRRSSNAVLGWEEAFGSDKESYLRSAALQHAIDFYGVTYLLEYYDKVKLKHSSKGAAWKEAFPAAYYECGTVVQKASHFFEVFRINIESKDTMMVISAPYYIPVECTNPYKGVKDAGFILSPSVFSEILKEAVYTRCFRQKLPHPGQGTSNTAASRRIIEVGEAILHIVGSAVRRSWLEHDPDYNSLTSDQSPNREKWRRLASELLTAMARNKKVVKTEEDMVDKASYRVVGTTKIKAGLPRWAKELTEWIKPTPMA